MNPNLSSFDLRLDSVRAAYQSASQTPRQLILSLRDKAAALNPTITCSFTC